MRQFHRTIIITASATFLMISRWLAGPAGFGTTLAYAFGGGGGGIAGHAPPAMVRRARTWARRRQAELTLCCALPSGATIEG